ncbi:Prolipoprotein diacylglyceryl transferase [Cellulophaga algicola DSM 14237]|uniref:Phosphatidylglycerol--prolipoprotein diacylglyceryl transferase n=1 Tax=Cellulophaga algicola (strain DSM 14237 / IC166 / ACAM 630) TaxID=688270 RepID=E6XBK8_CELAD|nr:prolipoprotein diacylglyceryl transferase [Cellulophaga algicola]ADV47843.1 Prolipoprotein diacylglyceryl transferase [Cellulophaga algicola DSM 14237]
MYFLGIIWNPNDTLFKIGFIQIKYYNLLWIAAFAFGWYLMKKIFLKEKKTVEQLDSLFIYTVLATMLGARLGHVIFYDWPYYKNNLIEILLPIKGNPNEALFGFINGYEFTGFTGLASHGAAIGIIVAMYLYVRKHPEFKVLWILDRIVIPVAIGAFFVRLGNFFNSEIVGKTVEKSFLFATKFVRNSDDLPAYKAMQLTNAKTPNIAYSIIENNPKFAAVLDAIPYRHPAQLYEGVCYIFVFIALYYFYWKTEKKDKPGFLFGAFLVLLWSIRFFVEFVKERQNSLDESMELLSIGQWLSIPFVLIGLYFMFRPTKS